MGGGPASTGSNGLDRADRAQGKKINSCLISIRICCYNNKAKKASDRFAKPMKYFGFVLKASYGHSTLTDVFVSSLLI